MDTPGDGLVVGRIEGVGEQAPVPTDDVERVEGDVVDRAGQPTRAATAVLDVDLRRLRGVGADVLGEQRPGGDAQVALAVGGVLQQLPEAGEVALRRGDVRVGLDADRRAAARRRGPRRPVWGASGGWWPSG
jgi:hypothetical protein